MSLCPLSEIQMEGRGTINSDYYASWSFAVCDCGNVIVLLMMAGVRIPSNSSTVKEEGSSHHVL